ncbi:MAG: metallophosphoesterase, partial [Myxococcaceae bacterium]|nr:metallophosphoesterase [Myxococcaceae bacterium]
GGAAGGGAAGGGAAGGGAAGGGAAGGGAAGGGAAGGGAAGGGAPGGGAAGGSDPILVGAGDISICGSANGEPTAKLLDGLFANGANSNGVVFTAGDNAYNDGTLTEYQTCYGPTWGRHKARTRPAPGNHERDVTAAGGYFQYFGANAGDPTRGAYYSYDLGKWHVVVIDSFGASVSAGSAQEKWLRADLQAHPNKCTVAIFHAPRFNSGSQHGSSTFMQPVWQALYDFNADVVISGHEHVYERFAPQTPSGALDASRGLRQFLVGTGGGTLYSFGTALPNSEVRYASSYGLLKLTLHDATYDWEFLPVAGATFTDKGSGACH